MKMQFFVKFFHTLLYLINLSFLFQDLISAQATANNTEDIASTAINSGFKAPDFCGGLQCPPFESICSKDGIELRTYEPTTWAYVDVADSNKVSAINTGFRTLFNYLNGQNSQGRIIPMTTPVLISDTEYKTQTSMFYSFVDAVFGKRKYRTQFYLAKNETDDLPTPNDSSIKILNLGEKSYFTYYFPGYVWALYFNNKYSELKSKLNSKFGISIKANTPNFVAGYDPPDKFIGRRNEIWVEIKDPSTIAKFCDNI